MMESLEGRALLSATFPVVAGLVHTTATLSRARSGMAAVSVDRFALFAGGYGRRAPGESAAVDIYDSASGAWSAARLSQARVGIAAATVGHLALFAGGFNSDTGQSDAVDIFDAETGQWSAAKLSAPADHLAVAVVGDTVLFAGGGADGSAVDMFHADTGLWSTAHLSRGRGYIAASVVGDLAIFAGGYTTFAETPGGPILDGADDIDIFDARHNTWSTAKLSHGRGQITAASIGGRALFAGGGGGRSIAGSNPASDAVDIFDAATGHWSSDTLAEPRVGIAAATVGGRVLFAGGGRAGVPSITGVVDVFDINGHHSTQSLAEPTTFAATAVVAGRAIFATGGILTGTGDGTTATIFRPATGRRDTTPLSQSRRDAATVTTGNTALFAGGFRAGGPNKEFGATDVVDLFTYDDTPPGAAIVGPLTPIGKNRETYTFSVAYHDAFKVDPATLDDADILVTGPNGFAAPARLVSQTRGRHASTRIATYAIDPPGRRWDASDNGRYTLHLQAGQVGDSAGNAAVADHLSAFAAAIKPSASTAVPPHAPAVRRPDEMLRDRSTSDLLD